MENLFSNIKEGMIGWLGCDPNDHRINVKFYAKKLNNGIPFYVNNGCWKGVLFNEDDKLYIIDERGTKHDLVFIVELKESEIEEIYDNDLIPF